MHKMHHQGKRHPVFSFLPLIFLLILSSTALAQVSIWQGPYVGAYLGGGFANNHASTNAGTVTATSYFTTSADIGAVNDSGTSVNNPSSLIAGVQAGHDWAWQQMVYGVVFDYGALPLSSSKKLNNIPYPDNSNHYSVYTAMNTNWLFTLRGRVGYATLLHWPSVLYLTGGMAMTQLKVNTSFSDNTSTAAAGGSFTSDNKVGWTLGAGLELASYGHTSLDLEYLFVHVPSVKVASTISNTAGGFGVPAQSLTSPFTTTGSFHASLLKIALNYRLDE